MARERNYRIHRSGEQPTAAFALWVDLTREQVAAVERVAGSGVSVRDFLRRVAIEAIKAQVPDIGTIYRESAPQGDD
jgi:hypothetical protein